MRFLSVPIFKSGLQVILIFWMLPIVTFFCLFALHERAHSLSPSQVCHFPLHLLNASYPNGMFSRVSTFHWPGCPRMAAQTVHSRLPLCSASSHLQKIRGSKNPTFDPRTPDSFSDLEQTPMQPSESPSVPIKIAAG